MLRKTLMTISIMILGISAPAVATAAPSTVSNDVSRVGAVSTDTGPEGVLAWCTSSRPAPGSVPYGRFGGTQSIACLKCDETGRVLRAKGEISAYSCEYLSGLQYGIAYVVWI